MKKFLVLYHAPISAKEQMADATPEQATAGMKAWMEWAEKAGRAVVDLGAPLGNHRSLNSAVTGLENQITGYSILQADSMNAVTELLREHPDGRVPNSSIEVLECLPIPGSAARPASRVA